MKRRKIKILLIGCMGAVIGGTLFACEEGAEEFRTVPTLAAPTNVQVIRETTEWEDLTVVWDEVEGATGYEVEYGEEREETVLNFLYLPKYEENTEIEIKVRALSGEGEGDSEWGETKFLYETPTEALSYSLTEDMSGYEVARKYENVNTGLKGRVVIPDYYNGLPVKKISYGAFRYFGTGLFDVPNPETGANCNRVTTEIRLPAYLEEIDAESFRYCLALQEIEIPEGVTVIGEKAFQYCSALREIEIPEVATIRESAFGYCSTLREIEIPEGVTTIGERAFEYCQKLEKAKIPSTLTEIPSHMFFAAGLTEIEIPSTVTTIGAFSFAVTQIREIDIPVSVTTIGVSAFAVTQIREIDIPSSVTTIGYAAFAATKIEEIVIPDTVISFGTRSMFQYCENLRRVTFPEGIKIKKIEVHSFLKCKNLEEIVLPSAVDSIDYYAFEEARIKKLTISKGVKEIDEYAFAAAEIENIVLEEGNEAYYVQDNCLIEKETKTLIWGGKDSEIPTDGSVTSIGEYAFFKRGLTSIVLPKSVTSVGEFAFGGNAGLESIVVEEGNETYYVQGNCLIEKETKTLILGGKNSVIPTDGSVTSIGAGSFCGSGVVELFIPDGITNMEGYAFWNCKDLTEISLPVGLEKLYLSSFDGCTALKKIYFRGQRQELRIASAMEGDFVIGTRKIICTDGEFNLY